MLSAVRPARNGVLQAGRELFNRPEREFAESVDYFNVAWDLALGGVTSGLDPATNVCCHNELSTTATSVHGRGSIRAASLFIIVKQRVDISSVSF